MYRSDAPVNPEMLVMVRELRSLTLEQVAEQSGIPLDVLTGYETDGGVLPPQHLRILARGYAVPPGFFQQQGHIERRGHVCWTHDVYDDMLEPVQALLDECYGERWIVNAEWLEDGIYRCHYAGDDDQQPYARVKLGNTVLQAETAVMRLRPVADSGGE